MISGVSGYKVSERKGVVVLEWTFTPPDYFEETIYISRGEYNMIIDNGKVEARINPDSYDEEHNKRNELHEKLNARFLGFQLHTHKAYKLSKGSMYRLYPDGRRDVNIFLEPATMRLSMNEADILIKDKDHNVISDSRKKRIGCKQYLAENCEKYYSDDPLLRVLLNSYNAAVEGPGNEFIYLYEIREALEKLFGSVDAAKSALAISENKWSRFGKLANNAPIRQGRHRGRNALELRDATKAELDEARNTACSLIIGYLKYLEKMVGNIKG